MQWVSQMCTIPIKVKLAYLAPLTGVQNSHYYLAITFLAHAYECGTALRFISLQLTRQLTDARKTTAFATPCKCYVYMHTWDEDCRLSEWREGDLVSISPSREQPGSDEQNRSFRVSQVRAISCRPSWWATYNTNKNIQVAVKIGGVRYEYMK